MERMEFAEIRLQIRKLHVSISLNVENLSLSSYREEMRATHKKSMPIYQEYGAQFLSINGVYPSLYNYTFLSTYIGRWWYFAILSAHK
jgi:hypothetical protein